MDELTEIENLSPFKIEELSAQPYEKDDFTRQDVTIEMNLDLRVIARDGYTMLDWVSDVGGIQGMLISVVVFILSIWNHNYLDNYMVSSLF